MKKIHSSNRAPAAIGPYSQAVQHGDMIFCSGQIPIHPETGEIVEGGFEEQAIRVLENIKGFLEDIGSSMDKVVKTTVFLKNMDDYPNLNEIYGEYFTQNHPARSAVEVAKLPKNVLIEIEVIATS